MCMSVDTSLLTVGEVGSLLRVDRATVRRWVRAGDLPAIRIGRTIRIDVEDLGVKRTDSDEPVSRTQGRDK